MQEYKEFIKEEQTNLLNTTIEDDYKNFLDKYEEQLENEFNKENEFQTSVRGLKLEVSSNTRRS